MKKSTTIIIVILILVVLLGAYMLLSKGSVSPAAAIAPQATTTQSVAAPLPVTPILTIASSTALGEYLVATNGMTVYEYKSDPSGVSTCLSGICAANWHAYLVSTSTSLTASSGINGTIRTITRPNGTHQVTYNGKPLYFWVHDTKPGETSGNGIKHLWLVVHP